MNLMIQPNQICLIVKLYNNRPELLPDSNVGKIRINIIPEKSQAGRSHALFLEALIINVL